MLKNAKARATEKFFCSSMARSSVLNVILQAHVD